jgi:hypothetical protein
MLSRKHSSHNRRYWCRNFSRRISKKQEERSPTRPGAKAPRRGKENPSIVSGEPDERDGYCEPTDVSAYRRVCLRSTGSRRSLMPISWVVITAHVVAVRLVPSSLRPSDRSRRRSIRILRGDEPELLGRLTELPEKFLKGLDHGFSYGLFDRGQRLWNQYHDDPLYVEGFDIGRTVRALVLPDPPQESSNA